MTGPFETEEQARQLPAVRAVYAAFDADPGVGKMTPHNHRMLCEALSAAGVEVGAYDHQIALWLAGWEPATVAVITGWVQRASRAADTTASLSDTDRAAVDRARALADAISSDRLRRWLAASDDPDDRLALFAQDPLSLYSDALGAAQHLLAELARIITRPDGTSGGAS